MASHDMFDDMYDGYGASRIAAYGADAHPGPPDIMVWQFDVTSRTSSEMHEMQQADESSSDEDRGTAGMCVSCRRVYPSDMFYPECADCFFEH